MPPGLMSARRLTTALSLAATLALTATPAPATAGTPAQATASTAAIQQATAATTGQPNPSQLAPQDVCPAPTPGIFTCLAEALALGHGTGPFVHPRLKPAPSPYRVAPTTAKPTQAQAQVKAAQDTTATAPPQEGTPAYLQQAYDLSYLSQTAGAGDTVAVVDAFDDPRAEQDLATYRATFGLPPCTTANGCFKKVNQLGQPGPYPTPDSNWAVEISLDLDAVSALCPQCRIVLVEADSAYGSDLSTAQSEAAALGANQISDSWGGTSSDPAPPDTFTFPGIATVAAAGDDGYLTPGTNSYPAALSNVTAAGGTSLTPANAGTPRGYVETAWSGAGSGCDLSQSKPAWQTDTGCTGRSYDDLSADADPNTGMIVYDSGDQGWLVVGGTSEASPLIAAYYAVTGASAQSPAWAYQHASLLNDPVGGSNGSCGSSIFYICHGGLGYDGPTGAGSISGDVVAGGPGIGGPGGAGTYTVATSPNTARLQGGVYPNGAGTSSWVQYGTTTAYGQQSTPTNLSQTSSPTEAQATLTGLTPSTTYHYRLVAQNSFGTTYGYDYTFTTAPPFAPTVSSTAATVSGLTASLRAVVNPGGTADSYRFLYGTSPAQNHSSLTKTVSGDQNQTVAASLSQLAPRTTYYYQLQITGPAGTTAGPLLSFTTGAAPASSARIAGIASGGVALGRIALAGTRATVAVSCRTAAPCQVRVRLVLKGRTLAVATVKVPARHSVTVRLKLTRHNASLARAHRSSTRVIVFERLGGRYRRITGAAPRAR